MSPLSPHRPAVSLDHAASSHLQLTSSLPNIKQEIHSDDLIETLHQFHQQQRDTTDADLKIVEEADEDDLNKDLGSGSDLGDENNDAGHYNSLKQEPHQHQNSDDSIVPVSSNHQPNLQFPPSYQFQDNGATISFMNSKLQNTASRNSLNSSVNGGVGPELYPALQFDTNFITTIPESFSTSTISSFDSVPPTLTHSITNSFSNASLQISPQQQQQQQQQQLQTPARASRKHSITNGTVQTPLQLHTSNIPQYQTPLRKTPSITPHRKGHQRTRSRLSLDANGSAIISVNGSSATTLKSPGGVNPFYTPPSFLSPRPSMVDNSPQQHPPAQQHQQQQENQATSSYIQTPFATPLHSASASGAGNTTGATTASEDKSGVSPYLLLKKEHKRFKSNEFHDFSKAADLSLQLADKLMNHSHYYSTNSIPLLIDPENIDSVDHATFNQHINNNNDAGQLAFNGSETISRSRSSMNLSTTLMASPPTLDQQQKQQQFVPMHQHNASIPQNIYNQFDKLNFVPEIQQQPYAPLVQFSADGAQLHHHHDQIHGHPGALARSQSLDNVESKVEIIVESKKEKKQKMHQCPLCGGRFQRPEHVKRHMRSHSSEKPFVCGICNKRFNRNDNMKAHERKIHGIDKGKKKDETK